jgi:hypothetical protein
MKAENVHIDFDKHERKAHEFIKVFNTWLKECLDPYDRNGKAACEAEISRDQLVEGEKMMSEFVDDYVMTLLEFYTTRLAFSHEKFNEVSKPLHEFVLKVGRGY